MAVNFQGIQTQAPQLKKASKPQAPVAFQGLQKADTVSFGNSALVKVAQEAPKTGILKGIASFVMKYAKVAWDFIAKCGKTIIDLAKKLNPMKLFKGKGAEKAAEAAQALVK